MVIIGLLVSEEKSFEIVDRRMDGRRSLPILSSPGSFGSGELKTTLLLQHMRKNDASVFFHDASILLSVGVFLTHRFETVGVFAHFLCVKNAKRPLFGAL